MQRERRAPAIRGLDDVVVAFAFERVPDVELDDLISDTSLDVSTRLSAVRALTDECARGLRDWSELTAVVATDDSLTAPFAAQCLGAHDPLAEADYLDLMSGSDNFWVKAELVGILLAYATPSSRIFAASDLDDWDDDVGTWELYEQARRLVALGHRLGEPLLILVATCPRVEGYLNAGDFETILDSCGPSSLLAAWHQLSLELERYPAIDLSAVAELLRRAGLVEAAVDAIQGARKGLSAAVVHSRLGDPVPLIDEWDEARKSPGGRLAVLREAAAAGLLQDLDLHGAVSGATAEETLEIVELLQTGQPTAATEARARAAEQFWTRAASGPNDADRVKALMGLASCGDHERLFAFASNTGEDRWLRHRAGLGLIELGLVPLAAEALSDLLASGGDVLGDRLFRQLQVYRSEQAP